MEAYTSRVRQCAALAMIALGGCNGDLPAASFVEKLRVLAVQADPPEVAPGETTSLRALAVEPAVSQSDGAAPLPISALWLACRIPAGVQAAPCGLDPSTGVPEVSATSAPPLCADDPSASLCIVGTELSAQYTPDGAAIGSTGTGQLLLTLTVADDAGGATGCLTAVAENGGLPTDSDHCVIALKRLTVSTPEHLATNPRNSNPTLVSFDLTPNGVDGGDEIDLIVDGGTGMFTESGKQSSGYKIAVDRAAGSSEIKSDGTYESLILSWFTTSGSIDGGRSLFAPKNCDSQSACPKVEPSIESSTTWTAPTSDMYAKTANGEVLFWAVLRDDRGGESWLAGSASPQ